MNSAKGREEKPFLTIPPFPNAGMREFERLPATEAPISDGEADRLLELLTTVRVGGSYWGHQPPLPGAYRVIRSPTPPSLSEEPIVWWRHTGDRHSETGHSLTIVETDCDPWHLLASATELACPSHDREALLLAGLAGLPVRLLDRPAPTAIQQKSELRMLVRELVANNSYLDPFSGRRTSAAAIVELCGFWRKMIDANRDFAGAFGFAAWKRSTTAPLLWGGRDLPFDPCPSSLARGAAVALWRSRVSADRLAELDRHGAVPVEVEDGFIRSAGLGANCVPPQSILVDRLGIHFDAHRPSELELMLQDLDLSGDLLARAEAMRERIVASGLSKYDMGHERLERRSPLRHILVPGQVEDDRAVLEGLGGPLFNRDLLARVREQEPDAYVIYKPHPDVEAGHRRGALPDREALGFADEVVRAPSISSWIDLVDEVHVNSSLAGFEALMRGKRVTTYGAPFYAGWGLTRHLGPLIPRRTRQRSITELVAICLLVYPRYVDPRTNLPCPLEVLVERLLDSSEPASTGPLVMARRLQGWFRRLSGRLKPS
jgi:capsular polysaccharide export protein